MISTKLKKGNKDAFIRLYGHCRGIRPLKSEY